MKKASPHVKDLIDINNYGVDGDILVKPLPKHSFDSSKFSAILIQKLKMLDRFFKKLKSKTPNQAMYPELEKVGGLQNAIDIEFEKLNSELRVTRDSDLDNIPLTFALIKSGQKFSQICIGAEEKLYLADFWKEGVCLAHGVTKNISDLAEVIGFWHCNNITTRELADNFSFVVPNDKAFAFDENNEVEYTWNLILKDKYSAELNDFVKLAIKDEVLNKLFPFTSLYTLCFSKCTGYPYDTYDLPNVTPKQFENFAPIQEERSIEVQDRHKLEFQFIVTKNKSIYLGEGNAEDALRIVKANLPDNIQPARKGAMDK